VITFLSRLHSALQCKHHATKTNSSPANGMINHKPRLVKNTAIENSTAPKTARNHTDTVQSASKEGEITKVLVAITLFI